MTSLRTTNWLLLGIFLTLAAHLALRWGFPPATAETLKLDSCITSVPNEKPTAYVHVVSHDFSGN